MGMSISWIGVRGASTADVLRVLELTDTGEECDRLNTALSIAEWPGGWIVIASRDSAWMEAAPLLEVSQLGFVLGFACVEMVNYSEALAVRDGELLWRVLHDRENQDEEIVVEGEAPSELQAVLSPLEAKAADDDGVDYFFDAPEILAEVISGIRIEDPKFEDVVFTALEGPPKPAPPARDSRGGGLFGFIQRLLGG